MFFTLTDFECFFGIIDHAALQFLLQKQPFSLLTSRHSLSIKQMITEICELSKEQLHLMVDTLLEKVHDIVP